MTFGSVIFFCERAAREQSGFPGDRSAPVSMIATATRIPMRASATTSPPNCSRARALLPISSARGQAYRESPPSRARSHDETSASERVRAEDAIGVGENARSTTGRRLFSSVMPPAVMRLTLTVGTISDPVMPAAVSGWPGSTASARRARCAARSRCSKLRSTTKAKGPPRSRIPRHDAADAILAVAAT